MTTESKAVELQERLAALAKETAQVQAQLKDLNLKEEDAKAAAAGDGAAAAAATAAGAAAGAEAGAGDAPKKKKKKNKKKKKGNVPDHIEPGPRREWVKSNFESAEEKFKIARSVGVECTKEEELQTLFEKKPHPVCYDGFEPSGRMHIAQVCVDEWRLDALRWRWATVV